MYRVVRIVCCSIFTLIGVFLLAQQDVGHFLEPCHQQQFREQIRLKKTELYDRLLQDRQMLNKHTANYIPQKADDVYIIPIVFHILHNGGQENIADTQIYEALEILNRDYRRMNDDADLVKTEFQGMPTDVKIEFRLATIAPDGTCFGGITRTKSWRTSQPGNIEESHQVKEVFNNNDVYRGMWPHEKYLNVVVAQNIGGAGGYTDYPNNQGTYMNTIFIQHITLGESGTAVQIYNRSLTHEVGHWLNLMHTWGDSNSPGLSSNCDIDDDVSDTPNTVGLTSCDLTNAACGVLANVENYMEYSFCSKMFTPGQVQRMRAALTSSVGQRNNIWSQENLLSVGAIEEPPLCKVDFFTKKTRLCVGDVLQFENRSYNSVDSYSWTFEGGTPSSSTEQNPSVQYNIPGLYTVTLTVSSKGNILTTTKTAYIKVFDSYSNLPYHEGFEYFPNIENVSDKLFVENSNDQITFEISDQAFFSGNKSVKLHNFENNVQSVHSLVSTPIDLSHEAIGDLTFSYRYAYRKKNTQKNESLKTYFSSDCGKSWTERPTSASSLVSSKVELSDWIPISSSDWKTIHILFNTQASAQFLTNNFRFKLEFKANEGNNLYIDDINLYRGSASDIPITNPQDKLDYENYIANISENMTIINKVELFPNPNDGELQLNFAINRSQIVIISVVTITGQVLQKNVINASNGENIVHLSCSDFSDGIYFIELKTMDDRKQTLSFIKQ